MSDGQGNEENRPTLAERSRLQPISREIYSAALSICRSVRPWTRVLALQVREETDLEGSINLLSHLIPTIETEGSTMIIAILGKASEVCRCVNSWK